MKSAFDKLWLRLDSYFKITVIRISFWLTVILFAIQIYPQLNIKQGAESGSIPLSKSKNLGMITRASFKNSLFLQSRMVYSHMIYILKLWLYCIAGKQNYMQ